MVIIKYAEIEFCIDYERVDDSFDYPGFGGGTHVQHHYEITSVKIGDAELIDLLKTDVIVEIENILTKDLDL